MPSPVPILAAINKAWPIGMGLGQGNVIGMILGLRITTAFLDVDGLPRRQCPGRIGRNGNRRLCWPFR